MLASAVARRWGSDAQLAPDRAGFSERTKKLGQNEQLIDRLEAAWAAGRETDDLWLYVEQSDTDLVGDLRCFDELDQAEDHTVEFSFEPEGVDLGAVIDLACDLFVAIDGYYGHIDTVAMADHQLALALDGVRRRVVPRVEASDKTTWRFDHHIDGPWWVNFYGPAFADRWGELAGELGIVRRRLANGGLMVMTAAEPVAVDPTITELLGYPHQQDLVRQVGVDVFRHETGSLDLGEAGASVPLRSEHERAACFHSSAGG